MAEGLEKKWYVVRAVSGQEQKIKGIYRNRESI
jgi:transcription antitermination factor NusG